MTQNLAPGLYVVATPIGNLGDLSEHANSVLKAADVVAAEDTRTSGFLVKRAGGTGKMVSLTEHNVESRAPGLLEAARTEVVALVSDAGTPVIADPGGRLVEAAHAAGVLVVPIPGPSALAAAISVSGFEGTDVLFLGFLPKAHAERVARLKRAATNASVFVFFESPNRLAKTLAELAGELANPEVVVCRELTKVHEEVVRGRASALATRFEGTRGECTVVVRSGTTASSGAGVDAMELLAAMKRAGARRSSAAAETAKLTGRKRDELYAEWDSL
ncbi:MAG: 16S rRNA (cytidine(1402)-2'-O)-methyltransferase [Dehalococcoidia bacterium]